jgi:hypothetical protein
MSQKRTIKRTQLKHPRNRKKVGGADERLDVYEWSEFQKELENLTITTDPFPPITNGDGVCTFGDIGCQMNSLSKFAKNIQFEDAIQNITIIKPVEGTVIYDRHVVFAFNDDSAATDLDGLYNACMSTQGKITLASGYILGKVIVNQKTYNIGHYVALVCWFYGNTLQCSCYDPIYYVTNTNKRYRDNQGRVIQNAIKTWNKNNPEKLTNFYSISEFCRKGEQLDNEEGFVTTCPQYYVNAEYCMYYAMFFIVNFMICLKDNSGEHASTEKLFTDAVLKTYVIPMEELSRESTIETIKYKVVTTSFVLTSLLYFMFNLKDKVQLKSIPVKEVLKFKKRSERLIGFAMIPPKLDALLKEMVANLTTESV